jgi:YhgE/Pip-like protein
LSTPPPQDELNVTPRQILGVRKTWILPLLIAGVFVALISVIYIGSIVNPTGHLHGLPVLVVNEDTGASVNGQKLDLGTELVSGLEQSVAITSRLKLRVVDLSQAQANMNRAGAYATLVIPSTLSRSVLVAAGALRASSAVPATPSVNLMENSRLGSLGVSIAAGVLAPAVSKSEPEFASKLAAIATSAAKANPVNAALLASPLTLTTSQYEPLPDHSGLGLSAFYAALLAIMSGFLGATLINSSIDSALGYSATEMGPRRVQRRPVRINRRNTFIVKWVTALLAAPVLTGVMLLVSALVLRMHAPDWALLWLLLAFAALMISTGTLALLAAFGSMGQLLAMILLVYLSLASSGGTVPIQALPGFFKLVGHIEPLRNVLDGSRAIMYFGARGDAGLDHSLIVIGCELVFWAIFGLGITAWYDKRKLYRLAPDLLSYVERSIEQRLQEVSDARSEKPASQAPAAGG